MNMGYLVGSPPGGLPHLSGPDLENGMTLGPGAERRVVSPPPQQMDWMFQKSPPPNWKESKKKLNCITRK